MYYIQITSNNRMMTVKGWMTIDQRETKAAALEVIEMVQEALDHKESKAAIRVISDKDWRKEIWGA
jgi:hypothetical protein